MASNGSAADREAQRRPSFVIISGYQDYRSRRKVDLHFIADELRKKGPVGFVSLRFSYLSRLKVDPRHNLWEVANKKEAVDGIDCYLWRTPLHPFRLPKSFAAFEAATFAVYSKYLPSDVRQMVEQADTAFLESGIAIVFAPLLRRLNPKIRIVYLASDSLDAIGQADAVKNALVRHAHLIDYARVPSPLLVRGIPPAIPCRYIPHGIDKPRFASIGPSPFEPNSLNAVCVGSMLFDPEFFEIAGPLFPYIRFHVIGSGHDGPAPRNVKFYPEMPFETTLPYLKHSSFAIAPYGGGVDDYLTHTSMKLMQYNYLGVPAVCPNVVAGVGLGRFGYTAKDAASIKSAIERALRGRGFSPQKQLDWSEVTELLLSEGEANLLRRSASDAHLSASPCGGLVPVNDGH